MKFRFHRGGLAESMATMVEIEPTMGALSRHIVEWCPDRAGHPIKVEHYSGPDRRIGWDDTFIVTSPGYGVIGMTDSMPHEATDTPPPSPR